MIPQYIHLCATTDGQFISIDNAIADFQSARGETLGNNRSRSTGDSHHHAGRMPIVWMKVRWFFRPGCYRGTQ
jgi:hypothetical protein